MMKLLIIMSAIYIVLYCEARQSRHQHTVQRRGLIYGDGLVINSSNIKWSKRGGSPAYPTRQYYAYVPTNSYYNGENIYKAQNNKPFYGGGSVINPTQQHYDGFPSSSNSGNTRYPAQSNKPIYGDGNTWYSSQNSKPIYGDGYVINSTNIEWSKQSGSPSNPTQQRKEHYPRPSGNGNTGYSSQSYKPIYGDGTVVNSSNITWSKQSENSANPTQHRNGDFPASSNSGNTRFLAQNSRAIYGDGNVINSTNIKWSKKSGSATTQTQQRNAYYPSGIGNIINSENNKWVINGQNPVYLPPRDNSQFSSTYNNGNNMHQGQRRNGNFPVASGNGNIINSAHVTWVNTGGNSMYAAQRPNGAPPAFSDRGNIINSSRVTWLNSNGNHQGQHLNRYPPVLIGSGNIINSSHITWVKSNGNNRYPKPE